MEVSRLHHWGYLSCWSLLWFFCITPGLDYWLLFSWKIFKLVSWQLPGGNSPSLYLLMWTKMVLYLCLNILLLSIVELLGMAFLSFVNSSSFHFCHCGTLHYSGRWKDQTLLFFQTFHEYILKTFIFIILQSFRTWG